MAKENRYALYERHFPSITYRHIIYIFDIDIKRPTDLTLPTFCFSVGFVFCG